tara:strand:- start:314 stop:748 length:435 start_codon:yes stop_codon:yes gene_type:complete
MPSVFSGARARFLVGGNPIGYCAGVSGEEAVDYEPIDTLDILEVREHVPVSYRASLSAAFFRLVGSPLKDYEGQNGKITIFPQKDDVLTSGVLDAEIQDKLEGKTIAKFTKVRAASKTFDVGSRGVVSENCSFVAIQMMDESEI